MEIRFRVERGISRRYSLWICFTVERYYASGNDTLFQNVENP
jgi:hypothetical protein